MRVRLRSLVEMGATFDFCVMGCRTTMASSAGTVITGASKRLALRSAVFGLSPLVSGLLVAMTQARR